MTKTCARRGCDNEVYSWLHPDYCSRTCIHQAGAEHDLANLLAHVEAIAAPVMTPDLLAAKTDAEHHGYTGGDTIDLLPGQPVGFDEPPARGWLARAKERLLG